jgi:thiol:disulfide interchange protein
MTAKMYDVLLDTPTVRRALRSKHVVPMRADWSHPDPEIKQELSLLGRRSIPLIVIYPASDGTPIVVSDYGPLSAEQIAALVRQL